MDNQDFNGYSNYETWLTALHLHNDYEKYNAVLEDMKECSNRKDFARLLHIRINCMAGPKSYYDEWESESKKSLLLFANINWDEIAESFESDGSYRPKDQSDV